MEFTSLMASLEETLAFANLIREAGGGNPLDALMPAVPEDGSRCLIARNLNFNCTVGQPDITGVWKMGFGGDQALRDRIADKLGLEKSDYLNMVEFRYSIVLPPEIGEVASAFDDAGDTWNTVSLSHDAGNKPGDLAPREAEVLRTFLPYIEAAAAEAREIGVLNEKGELIL